MASKTKGKDKAKSRGKALSSQSGIAQNAKLAMLCVVLSLPILWGIFIVQGSKTTASLMVSSTPIPAYSEQFYSSQARVSSTQRQQEQTAAMAARYDVDAPSRTYDQLLIMASLDTVNSPSDRASTRSLTRLLPDTLAVTHEFNLGISKDRVGTVINATREFCHSQEDQGCILLQIRVGEENGYISLRLIPEQVEELRSLLITEGEMLTNSSEARDQGQGLQDAETRLRQDRTYLQELKRLQQQAVGLTPLRDLAREISQVQGRIEQTEAALVRLTQSVLYDVVNISVTGKRPTPPVTVPLPYWQQVSQSFETGLDHVLNNLAKFSIAFALILPWLGLGMVPVLLVILFAVVIQRRDKEATARALHDAAEAALAAAALDDDDDDKPSVKSRPH
ncbi:MAG: hypothetical protein Alpg2KO_29450 [Alphaproteobacteria bacterium]